MMIESLIRLIEPFQIRCIYFPYLPASMMDLLSNAKSFVVGINSKYKNYLHNKLSSTI
jgi:hypothetical protein